MKLEDIIVFEDESIIVVDKPSGLVVNKSITSTDSTLQDLISNYLGLGKSLGIGERAGIVHRLDRETSGLLVIAKTQRAFSKLQEQFKSREVEKVYMALVHGHFEREEGVVEVPIGRVGSFGRFGVVEGGRESSTYYKVENQLEFKETEFEKMMSLYNKNKVRYFNVQARDNSLLKVMPKTGRTHQIRVHFKSINRPVVSDLIYGPSRLLALDKLWCKRLFLHAKSIEFVHPQSGRNVYFESELPQDLTEALEFMSFPR